MGKLRFRVPDHDLYDPRFWESAYVVSVFDEIPRPSECRFEGDLLCVDFESSETCKLSIPWPTKEFGPVVLTTTSLRSTNVPYSLRLELARGFIHRVRTCAFDWEHHLGLPIPNSYHTLMDQAMDFFIQAVIDDKQGECEEGNARRALDAAIDASRALSRTYTSKMLQIRILNGERLQTQIGRAHV